MGTFFKLALLLSFACIQAACTTDHGKRTASKNRQVVAKIYGKSGNQTGLERTRAQTAAGINKKLPELLRQNKTGPNRRNVITIRGDNGGLLTSYVYRINAIARRGDLVEISGNCDSACTLFLALPRDQLCIKPGTAFRFHRPYSGSVETSRRAANFMMTAYPRWVRNWLRRNGGLSVRLKSMDYAHAVRHVRRCEGESAVNLKTVINRVPGLRPRPI